MAQLMFPNIAGTAMQGFQQGQDARANRLIGLAMQNPDQSQQYLGQAATINPQAVMQVQDAQARNQYMQGLQQQQAQRMQQGQQEMMAKKAGAAARYWKAAMQTGNPAAKQAASQAVLPFLGEMAAAQGKPAPTEQDLESPQAMAGLDQIIAKTAYLFPQDKPIAVGSDTTLIDPNTHQVIYQGQGDAGVAIPGMTFNGMPVFRDKLGGLKDIRGNPIPSQGGGNGASVGAPVPGNAARATPQAPDLGQPADPSLIDGNVPQGTQVTQATGPDGTRVMFAMAPDTPDAVKTQTAASAGVTQPPPQGQAGGLQYTPSGVSALTQKIALARKMGASDDQIKAMVLGQSADPGQSGMNLLTDDGKALMDASIAHGYNMPMPSMGYGKAGTAAKAAAINSLAERFKGAGISPDAAVSQMMQGNTAISGLRSLQNVNAKIMGWEASASKQADIALGMSNQVGRTGVPIFNSWILAGRQGTGSKEVAQFNNTVNTLAEEYARVMGGGNSTATDSTRALAHTMLNSAMTQDQFAGVVAKMRQEMTARTQALQGAVNTQRGAAIANDGQYTSGWPGEAAPQQAPQGDAQPSPVDSILSKYGIQ